MNAYTLRFNETLSPIFRLFDGLIPDVDTQGDTDIKDGIQKIDDGNTEEGQAQVIKGEGEKVLEKEDE